MAGFLGSGGGSNPLFGTYRSLVGGLANSNGIGDLTYSPGSTTTYTVNNILIARNITIGANATLVPANANNLFTIICDTLTLNGTINASSTASTTVAAGGAGGKAVLILARQIIGNGIVQANGGNGYSWSTTPNASSSVNSSGATNMFGSAVISPMGGGALSNNNYGGAGGTLTTTTGSQFMLYSLNWLDNAAKVLPVYFNAQTIWISLTSSFFAGGGGSAYSSAYSVSIGYGGGGGGSGAGGSGGNGGNGVTGTSNPSGGGSGGGGGGVIWIASENAIPALNLQAVGGNGGNAYNNSGGGGGGGGGSIVQYAPSSSATTNVNAGTGGSALGTSPGTAGSAGSNGIAYQFYFQAS